MPSNKLALVLLSVAGLAGCAIGPNFKAPPAPSVTSFTMQGDDAAPDSVTLTSASQSAQAWWRGLGSPELDEVMSQALAGNQDLKIADATLAEAAAAEGAARGRFFPTLDANAGYRREKINTSAFGFPNGFPGGPGGALLGIPPLSLYSVGGEIAYNLDLLGENRRRFESAAARRQAEEQHAQAAYLTLTGKVARQAILIASLRSEIAATEAIIRDDRNNLDVVNRAIHAGGTAKNTSTSAEAQLARDLALMPPLRQRLSEARHGLALLVGKTPGGWTAPNFDLANFAAPKSIPIGLPSELVHRRPDILAAEANAHAALADVGVAEAQLFPKISLSAALTQTTPSTTALFLTSASGWNIGTDLTAPIFHGGTLRANVRAKHAAAQRAMAEYRKTVLEAFTQVADVLEALGHDQEETKALERAEQSAAENLRAARLGFQNGGSAFINVLDAQREHSQAVRTLAEARGRRFADIALLYVATGADWQDASTAPKGD